MKSTVSVAVILVALAASSLAAHIEGLDKKTDFKTMSPDQVQSLLLNASSIEVHVAKNLVSDHVRMELCNGKKYSWASRDDMGEMPCVSVATDGFQDLNNAEILLRNMEALFRACGLYASSDTETYGDERSGYSCGLLGSLFYAIGNVPAARAAWDAPGCQSHDVNGHPLNGCMIFIISRWSGPIQLGGPVEWVDTFNTSRVDAYSSDRAKLISMATEACKQDLDVGSCNFLQTETGKQADWAGIENARRVRESDLQDRFAAEDAQREQESRDKNARFNSVMNTLQSMPGATDPNAIINAANQQATAIRATGDANAAQQAAAQQQIAVQEAAAQRLAVRQSQQANAQQVSPQNVATTNSVSGNSNNAGPQPSTTATTHYVTALPSSCIGQFWDPKYYNWLSFQNGCGVAIHLSWIAASQSDTFGMSAADLAPGGASNSGWNQAEVQSKGGFLFLVCPVGYLAVDATTDQPVTRPNELFRCKQQ